MKSRKIALAIVAVIVAALGVLTIVRREAWFGNPPEPDYVVDSCSNRLLTYGRDTSLLFTYRDNCATPGSVHIATAGGRADYHAVRAHRDTPHIRTILLLGDIQDCSDSDALVTRALLRRIVARHHPDVILQSGDLLDRPHQAAWQRFSLAFDSIDTVIPIISALGNHDYYKGLSPVPDERFYRAFPYFRNCTPELPATAVISLVPDTLDLFIIDSNRSLLSLFRQSAWLNHALDSSRAPFKILMSHHPLRSAKSVWNCLTVRLAFDGLVRRKGVSMVVAGHEHTYAHRREPYHQIVQHFSGKDYDAQGRPGRHYTIIRVMDNRLEVSVYDERGERVETFDIGQKK